MLHTDTLTQVALLTLLVWVLLALRRNHVDSFAGIASAVRSARNLDVDVRVRILPMTEAIKTAEPSTAPGTAEPATTEPNDLGPPLAADAVKNDQSNPLRSESDDAPDAIHPVRFLIDSLLLMQSYRYVCPAQARRHANGFQEAFHYATGVRVDERTYVITRIVPVRYSEQSAGGVRVADGSNIEALATLDRLGLPLLGHMHSHPGFGREANRPSSTDRSFQERLERGRHIAIGAIFSRDGFVRWFAGDLDRFVVEVQGKNVRKVADNEFQLELDNAIV